MTDSEVLVNGSIGRIGRRQLTIEEKLAAVEKVTSGADSAVNIARTLNVQPGMIRQLIYRYRKGGWLQQNVGRPRALDPPAIASVQELMVNDQHFTTDDLDDKIVDGYISTKHRKHIRMRFLYADDVVLPDRMPVSSLYRYRNMFYENTPQMTEFA